VPTIIFLLFSLLFLPLYAETAQSFEQTQVEKKQIGTDLQVHFSEAERAWIKQHPVIHFTGDPNWLPFEAFTKEGEYIGIIADVLKLIEDRIDIKFNKIPTKTWKESVSLLKSGKIDMLTETTDSPLKSEFLFTQVITSSPIVVVMQEGSPYVHTLQQIKTKKIAIIKEYGYINKIKEQYPEHHFYEVENIEKGLSAVAEGKYDALLATMALASYQIRKMKLSSIRVIGRTEFSTQLGFAIKREYAPLVDILNKIKLDELTKQEILSKWIKQEYVEKIDYRLIWEVLGVSLLIILGIFFWSLHLKREITRRSILEKELVQVNKQITDSIEFASIIQQAFVPEEKDLADFFEDEFTLWKPRDIVGGDIYFFDKLYSEHKAVLMVIDCTGHGVPGAFVTMLVKALARNFISDINQNKKRVSPAELLAMFNRALKDLLQQHDKNSLSNAGFDAAILYIDKEESRITYAGANIPLFYMKEGMMNIVKADRHSIGYKTSDPYFEFHDHELAFDENIQFYISSDGYMDQTGGRKGFPMGKKRMTRLLEEHNEKPMKEQQVILEEALISYQREEDRNDDITIVGFRCKGVNS